MDEAQMYFVNPEGFLKPSGFLCYAFVAVFINYLLIFIYVNRHKRYNIAAKLKASLPTEAGFAERKQKAPQVIAALDKIY